MNLASPESRRRDPRNPGSVWTSTGYHSRVIYLSTKTGGNAFVFPAGEELTAFSYGIGDAMTPAVSAGITQQATLVDTNVEQGGKTREEDFTVRGISLISSPANDGEILRQMAPEISVLLKSSSAERPIGPLLRLPGSGGILGSARQDISAANSTILFASNGQPLASNVYPVPEGFKWSLIGPDSNLRVIFRTARAVTVQGVVGSPATLRLDFTVILHGTGVRARSVNV